MTQATHLDWPSLDHFAPSEWPEGVLDHMDPRVIQAAERIRLATPDSHALTPSPVARGHVRHEAAGSRHATDNGRRLSDATDLFCRWPHLWALWTAATQVFAIGGLGVYTDMAYGGVFRVRPMLHIDCRPDRIMWVGWRDNRDDPIQYTYLHSEPELFFKLLAERGV